MIIDFRIVIHTVNIITDSDIEILRSLERGIIITFWGQHHPFAVIEAYKLGYFLAGGNIPDSDSCILAP
jgi:hypothetical protein